MDDSGIQRLLKGTPHASREALLAHPRFAEARKLHLDRFLALYGADHFLVRLVMEQSRFLVYLIAAVLGAGFDPARRESWLTVGRLKQLMTGLGLASDRQVDHLVSRLCEVDFLQTETAPQDKRVRLLRPTEKMLAHDREWLAMHYAALALLCPLADYGPILRRDPAFHRLLRAAAIPLLPLGARLLTSQPDLALFFERAGGPAVLAALLQAALGEPDRGHASAPYADIGDRFGLSRTHVRQLLFAAREKGLIGLPQRGGHRVEILPRLWASYDRGFADALFLHDLMFALATGRRAAA